MTACILSLSGEVLQVEGLENASTVAEVRALTAVALGCGAPCIKLVESHDGENVSTCPLSDEQRLEELPCKQLVAIRHFLDPSLVKLTSENNLMGRLCHVVSTLSYGDTKIWREVDIQVNRPPQGWSGSTHVAELSADKMVLTVTSGSVKKQSGRMSGKKATRQDFNVADLVASEEPHASVTGLN